MKLTLTHTKSGSTQRSYDALLRLRHFGGAGLRFIVEAMEVKKPMHEIEPQFVLNIGAALASLPFCGLRADNDLAVLKRDHVGRPGFLHESAVQLGDSAIGHEHDIDLGEARKATRFPPRQTETHGQRTLSEIAHPGEVDANRALTVCDLDPRRHESGRVSA